MRCAVTGGAGFIGSHVVDYLIQGGHEVVVLDHKAKPHRRDAESRDVDIRNLSALLAATEGCDFIFHLAAVSNVNEAAQQPLECIAVNIGGTANVLEAARQNGVKRVVFASTVWVYSGAYGDNFNEDSPFFVPRAGYIYTSSKIAGELLIHDYWRLYKQPFTILRYGTPYGPRMRETLVIPIFLKKAFAGEALTVAGDGSQYRNFVYVEDLARAHLLMMSDKAENQTYNLEGRRKVTVREVAETIDRLLGGEVRIEYIPARLADYPGKQISIEKARRELGWEPMVDFEEGMRRTIEWFKTRYQANEDSLSLPRP